MKEFAWFLGNVVKVNFSILGVLPKRITEKYFPYFLTLISVGGGGGWGLGRGGGGGGGGGGGLGILPTPPPPPSVGFPLITQKR